MRAFLGRVLLALLLSPAVQAGEVAVAVAANFTVPMQKIAAQFTADTGHKAVLAFGSTGKFYAQIQHGAPFDVLLAADQDTPTRLENQGWGAQRFTYAMGKLVLWSRQPGRVDDRGDVLHAAPLARMALADPKLAPYGAAALEVMQRLGVLAAWRERQVLGENIAQTYQFVATGNAPLGWVALSQVWENGRLREGSGWVVPAHLYAPLRQDAILLRRGQGNPAALALMTYLRGDKARAQVRAHGYEL